MLMTSEDIRDIRESVNIGYVGKNNSYFFSAQDIREPVNPWTGVDVKMLMTSEDIRESVNLWTLARLEKKLLFFSAQDICEPVNPWMVWTGVDVKLLMTSEDIRDIRESVNIGYFGKK